MGERLARHFPWTTRPLIISAPMRALSGPELAVAVSKAGGIGFIGPRTNVADWPDALSKAKVLIEGSSDLSKSVLSNSSTTLPIGIGFQVWTDDLQAAATVVRQYKPCVVWLFAPRDGQTQLDQWSQQVQRVSPNTQIWIQVGSVREACDAANSNNRPAAIVVQGTDAGGHGRAKDGLGVTTLLPEIREHIHDIPLLAAGGIVDGRGGSAALCLGASGIVMGTRFLATPEADIAKGYQQEILRVSEAGVTTTRTQLYNHLRGITNWPEQWSPRTIINQSFQDHLAGVSFEELKVLHDNAAKSENGWGPGGRLGAYVGTGIGLIHDIKDAATIVKGTQREIREILKTLHECLP